MPTPAQAAIIRALARELEARTAAVAARVGTASAEAIQAAVTNEAAAVARLAAAAAEYGVPLAEATKDYGLATAAVAESGGVMGWVRWGVQKVVKIKKPWFISGTTVVGLVVAGVIVYVGSKVAGEKMADKPIEAGQKLKDRQSTSTDAINNPLTGESLPGGPGSSNNGGQIDTTGFIAQVIPSTVDTDSFTGVWVRPGYIHGGISRVVLVHSGTSVKGRVEVETAYKLQNGQVALAAGTHELTGTSDGRTMKFTLGVFTGSLALGRTGMHLSGFMDCPGGPYLGQPVNLGRQIETSAKK